MLKTGEKIRRLLTVFITWAVLVMSFLGYEKYFVNREEEFLTARAFNSLGTISEEVGSQIHRAQLLTESYAQLAVLQHNDPQSNADPIGFLRLYFGELNQNHILERSVKLASACVNIKDRVPMQSDVVESDLNRLALSLSCFTRTVPGEYYHLLWSVLSAGERLVLYQLALDGWANPKNIAALQQLERKSLIRRGPMYRIVNESLREFVQGTEHLDEIEQWEKHEKQSTWRAFKLVLIVLAVGGAAWLLHSQAALSQVVVAYIAGIGTLLTAIAGLLGRSSAKSSPSPE